MNHLTWTQTLLFQASSMWHVEGSTKASEEEESKLIRGRGTCLLELRHHRLPLGTLSGILRQVRVIRNFRRYGRTSNLHRVTLKNVQGTSKKHITHHNWRRTSTSSSPDIGFWTSDSAQRSADPGIWGEREQIPGRGVLGPPRALPLTDDQIARDNLQLPCDVMIWQMYSTKAVLFSMQLEREFNHGVSQV